MGVADASQAILNVQNMLIDQFHEPAAARSAQVLAQQADSMLRQTEILKEHIQNAPIDNDVINNFQRSMRKSHFADLSDDLYKSLDGLKTILSTHGNVSAADIVSHLDKITTFEFAVRFRN